MSAFASLVPASRRWSVPGVGSLAVTSLAVASLAAVAACARTRDDPADSALTRDLTLASSAAARTPIAQPVVFADTTVAARPATPTPARQAEPAAAARPVERAPAVRRTADASPVTRPAAPAAPAEPTPSATPETAAPTASPAAASGAAGGSTGAGHSIAAGAGLALSLASQVCSATNRPGDRFVATLSQAITADDGTVLLPVGSSVVLELASATSTGNGGAHMELAVRGVSVDGFYRPMSADVADVDAQLQRQRYERPDGSARGKVGRGAMTGAILGSIFGHGAKGAIIGAAGGAAVGAASAAGSIQYQGCLPAGAPIRARLSESLAIG